MSNTARPSCVLTGEQSLLIQCGEALLAGGWIVECVFTDNPQIVRWARGRGVSTEAAELILGPAYRELEFDYLFSIGNLKVLPEAVIAAPRREAVNFHDGPLPEMAGLNVPNWAILEGRDSHAITWHVMTSAVDRGDILARIEFPIDPSDTALALNAKCFEAGLEAFRGLVNSLAASQAERRPQGSGERAYYGRDELLPNGGILRWTEPAERIAALVNAVSFGPYDNPLGLPRVWLGDRFINLGEVSASTADPLSPGSLKVEGDSLLVGTGTGTLSIDGLREMDGTPVDLTTFTSLKNLPPRELTETECSLLSAAAKAESRWLELRTEQAPLDVGWLFDDNDQEKSQKQSVVQASALPSPGAAAAAVILTALRLSGERGGLVAVADRSLESLPLLEAYRPLHAALEAEEDIAAFTDRMATAFTRLDEQGPLLKDLGLRTTRELSSRPSILIELSDTRDAAGPFDIQIQISLGDDATSIRTRFNRPISAGRFAQYEDALSRVIDTVAAQSEQLAAAVDIVSDTDRTMLLEQWNDAPVAVDEECIHHAFSRAAGQHRDAPAVLGNGAVLSFGELEHRAQALALQLQGQDIGAGDRVGICLERGEALVTAVLGVLMSGAAYVPLDPEYPAMRLHHIVEDAAPALILVSKATRTRLQDTACSLLGWDEVSTSGERAALEDKATPDQLAYLIYTSGSTGTPKGVMVEHRNVANFFAAMDACISPGTDPRWLSVTSLSFDISVLELLWTLTRGVGIVLYTGADRSGDVAAISPQPRSNNTPIDFSLFYFASDEGERRADQEHTNKYQLLIEGAKFADQHGFKAIWTPERHFHAFGGLYPNPSVAGAAIATITQHIHIRAGSCVLPLHDPIRITEEWALVDNLSNGRVGISFASGWQPNDFVLAPDNYENRHELMDKGIETVRALWRGESVQRTNPLGKEVTLSTLPRPVQDELPVWVTAAGNPATFRDAGRMGANLLTHLLGQSTEELREKIEVYHEAWRAAGHPGEGTVTLMLHTFVGDDEDAVRSHVHGPLKEYLRSSIGLIRKFADTFPAFKNQRGASGSVDFDSLSPDDLEALLEFAFERYYRDSGLFGSPERCARIVDSLKGIGINEIACLIDFGVPSDLVLAHLPGIEAVKRLSEPRPELPPGSVAELIQTHEVTHLQCTPSQAQMLLTDPDNLPALAGLREWLVGGEALPNALAKRIRDIATGKVINMYGPTETTIWSTTWPLPDDPEPVMIGTPIANTRCYVLDEALGLRPPGAPGELFIAGQGVTSGYHGNPDLTESRFLPDPFAGADARMYRTGDMVRWVDGALQFLGRIDEQVKVRGYRIELGDIEAALGDFEGLEQAVVAIKRDDGGDPSIVAYVRMPPGLGLDQVALRRHLNRRLPGFMLPQFFIEIDDIPLTPNGKVDRHALPGLNSGRRSGMGKYVPPVTETEKSMATIWSEVLGVEQVGIEHTFFELGGDSLSAVRVAVGIREKMGEQIPLETLLRATLEQSSRSLDIARERGVSGPGRESGGHKRKAGLISRLTKRKS